MASVTSRGRGLVQTLSVKAEIRCFRGIEGAEAPLTPITVVTGRNNSGKSSLLEAFALGLAAWNGFGDWLGRDILRAIINRKLSGHPYWLLRSRCNDTSVDVDAPWGRAEVLLRKPGREAARRLACRATGLLDERRLAFCLVLASAKPPETYLPAAWSLVLDVLKTLRAGCGSRLSSKAPAAARPGEAALLADALLAGLRSAAETIIDASVEVKANLFDGGQVRISRIYYPGDGFLRHLFKNHVRRSLKEAARGAAESLAAQGGGELDTQLLTDCIADAMESALLRAVGTGSVPKRGRGRGVRVFVLFHRLVAGSHGGLVETLTKTVRDLHGLGLLEEYNSLLKAVPSLGLSDPFIEEGEIWFRTSDGRIAAHLLGDGALHLLLLLAGLALTRGGDTVIVYEEPETGLHPGYMDVFARQLVKAVTSSRRVLVVLSTHSLELIRYLVDAARKEGATELLTTILMHEGGIFSVFRGAEVAEASELERDLRGI